MNKTLTTSVLAIALAGGGAIGVGSLAAASYGDEPPTLDEESVEQTAERFVHCLQAPMFIDDVEVPISASIGLVINSDAKTPDDVLK